MHKREKYISNRWYVDKYVNTIYSCVKTMRKKYMLGFKIKCEKS